MEKNRVLGLIAMTIVTIIYGVSYIAREVVAEYMHSTVIVGIQLIIMTVLFLLYNLAKKKSMKVSKKDLPMIILSGIFGTCLFHLFTVFSVTEIGANLSSLLYGFAAVFALTIDCTVRHRPLTKLSVASIIVSLVGVYILMGIIDGLRRQGKGIIYISHKMEEIFRIADDITVMRDGALIKTIKNVGYRIGGEEASDD